tara:strand:- start:340 stop:852 length:513 start_codon:yes stop_codon:yes gene_type:complete
MKKAIIFLNLMLFTIQLFALNIETDAFNHKEYIPHRYTCDTKDSSPSFSWSNVPEEAKSFVLICDDPDAPFKAWVHWVLVNIPKEVTSLKEGVSADELKNMGVIIGNNDFGSLGYRGPCPPPGKTHRYFFTLYALDSILPLKEGVEKKEVLKAIQGRILSETRVIGLYQR